jgi:hypothetical protein
MNFIKGWPLATGSMAQIKPIESVSQPFITDPTGGGADSCSRQRVAAERGGSPEFMFSGATVIGFR